MRLNFADPSTGAQKSVEIEDETKYKIFYGKRISQDVKACSLGDQFSGYVFRIMGGNDKQGFPMKQGVLTAKRVRLLLSKGLSCYRPRRDGERKRKSVRGCIVGPDISALSLLLVKKGEQEIPGLTDREIPRRLGPKRASKIRKLYNLSRTEDVKEYVLRREVVPKCLRGDDVSEEVKAKRTTYTKAPKIQRLITPERISRRRRAKKLKIQKLRVSAEKKKEYHVLLEKLLKERNLRRHENSEKNKHAE